MSWIEQEAQNVIERVSKKERKTAIFMCGFGASGLPHLGTISEVLRTEMVMREVENKRPEIECKLIVMVDDMDALRKVPTNVPNQDMLNVYLNRPLCDIPDPFGMHGSFSDHNAAMLINLLEKCGKINNQHYVLWFASRLYRSGFFDKTLMMVAKKIHEVKDVITHNYGDLRKETYCPFLPYNVDGTQIFDLYTWDVDNPEEGYLFFKTQDYDGATGKTIYGEHTRPYTEGHCKCQWKLDWPMRWMAIGVDYEMHGKDLLGSAQVGDKICRLFGYEPPIHMMYELFLDEDGKKISKSLGNGLEAEEWLQFAPIQSFQWFLAQNPRKSRSISWKNIPEATDAWSKQNKGVCPLSYSMLLNLVGITNTKDPNVLVNYLKGYGKDIELSDPITKSMVNGSIKFYEKFVEPHKVYRNPTPEEITVLQELVDAITYVNKSHRLQPSGQDILEQQFRQAIYDVGKKHYGKDELKNFFAMIYEVLMGQKSGPQINQFVMALGPNKFVEYVNDVLNGQTTEEGKNA